MVRTNIEVYNAMEEERSQVKNMIERVENLIAPLGGDRETAEEICYTLIKNDNFNVDKFYAGVYDNNIKGYFYTVYAEDSSIKKNNDEKKVPIKTWKQETKKSFWDEAKRTLTRLGIGVVAFGAALGSYKAGQVVKEKETIETLDNHVDSDLGKNLVHEYAHTRVNSDGKAITYYDNNSIGAEIAKMCKDNPYLFRIITSNVYREFLQYSGQMNEVYTAAKYAFNNVDKYPTMNAVLAECPDWESYVLEYMLSHNPSEKVKAVIEKIKVFGKDSLTPDEISSLNDILGDYKRSYYDIYIEALAQMAGQQVETGNRTQ